MSKTRSKGTLYLMGGSADTVHERFVELCGGSSAKILVLPHASSIPDEVAADTEQALTSYGAGKTYTIMPGSNAVPDADTTGVYMTGGDQARLVANLQPAILDFMKKLLARGGVVGGTSAGAAAAPETMIAGGLGDGEWPQSDTLLLQAGLGLLPGYVTDTHVHQRSRTDRLMVALARIPRVGGLGMDNDTAIEIRSATGYTHGKGLVRVYHRAHDFRSPLGKDAKQPANVRNMRVSILPAGERVRLY